MLSLSVVVPVVVPLLSSVFTFLAMTTTGYDLTATQVSLLLENVVRSWEHVYGGYEHESFVPCTFSVTLLHITL